jgi:hypothetical protein
MVSIFPALYALWVCEFSFSCYFGSITYWMIVTAMPSGAGIGILAVAVLTGPLIFCAAFVIVFLNCHKTRHL